MIQAGGRGFRHLLHGHSIHFRYVSGQMGTVEPNKKASIGGSKTETSEQSRAEQNNGNKNRKRCNIITHPLVVVLYLSLCLQMIGSQKVGFNTQSLVQVLCEHSSKGCGETPLFFLIFATSFMMSSFYGDRWQSLCSDLLDFFPLLLAVSLTIVTTNGRA
jgi:hypothetical protein